VGFRTGTVVGRRFPGLQTYEPALDVRRGKEYCRTEEHFVGLHTHNLCSVGGYDKCRLALRRNLTADELPSQFSPWTTFESIDLSREGKPTAELDTNECLEDIEKHGFHVTDAHVRITERRI
jgi:hypothetical protein